MCYKIFNFLKNYASKSLVFVCSKQAFTCSKLAIETLEQGVKYVES